jgi:hypothetical protein
MTKPVLYILDLNDEYKGMLEHVHAHLLSTLGQHFTVQLIDTSKAAQQAIADPAVKVVLASDKFAVKHVKPLLARGGTVVFACTFSTSTGMLDFDATFKSLGLPWVHGVYYR